MDSVTKSISIYYQNVRGLRTKSHTFLSNILNSNYDIICITETWLSDSFYNSEYFDNRYEVFRCDRDLLSTNSKGPGGGVCIAVRRELCPTVHSAWCAPPPADELWVSVPVRGCCSTNMQTHLHIACTYIPHGRRQESLLTSFYDRTCDIVHSHPDDVFLILGDFSVTHATWYYDEDNLSMDIHANVDLFTSLTRDFLSLSLLSQYNCMYNINNRLLDLVFCCKCCKIEWSLFL